jgi:hypothetical protein
MVTLIDIPISNINHGFGCVNIFTSLLAQCLSNKIPTLTLSIGGWLSREGFSQDCLECAGAEHLGHIPKQTVRSAELRITQMNSVLM